MFSTGFMSYLKTGVIPHSSNFLWPDSIYYKGYSCLYLYLMGYICTCICSVVWCQICILIWNSEKKRHLHLMKRIWPPAVRVEQRNASRVVTSRQQEQTGSLGVYSDSKVHGANMGPIWGRQDPGGPHIGPMNLAIWVGFELISKQAKSYFYCKMAK